MSILRHSNKESYTVISQNIFLDDRLSLKALGLLTKFLSLPNDWEFSENGMMTLLKKDGITSFRTAADELENLMYLKRYDERSPDGKFIGKIWEIVENPTTVNPTPVNQPQYNTKEQSNKKINIYTPPKKKHPSDEDELPTMEDIHSLAEVLSLPFNTVAAYKQAYLDWVAGNEKYTYGRHMKATVSNWLRRDLREGKIKKTQAAQILEMYPNVQLS